jgi:hypothetical protein
MGLQDEPEGPPLAVEGQQQLGAAVWGCQKGLHKALQ